MSSSWTIAIETAVPAPRLFTAAVLDWHNLAPKIAPEKIVSAAPIEGDGNVGSVRQFNFAPGTQTHSYLLQDFLSIKLVKERLDFVDVEKFEAKSTLVEGGGLGIRIESASTHIKIEPKAGGCVVKVTGSYKSLAGVNGTEEVEKAKSSFTGVIKGCEAYLLANPDAYN